MSVGTPAAMARVIMQSRADCVVACVAMLSGQPSARVWEVITPAVRRRTATETGLPIRDIRRMARRVGMPLRAYWVGDAGPEDIEELTGMLCRVPLSGRRRTWAAGHAVVWSRGVIINPSDGLIWPEETAYYRSTGLHPVWFLVPEG